MSVKRSSRANLNFVPGSGNGDVTLTGTQTLTNKTLDFPVIQAGELTESQYGIPSLVKSLKESVRINASSPGSFMELMFMPDYPHIQYWTSNTTANFYVYCQAPFGFDNILSVGESLTMVAIVKNGATAYKPSEVLISGFNTSVTFLWQGGGGIPNGNANAHDVYTFNIVKTASGTATVFASQTSFA